MRTYFKNLKPELNTVINLNDLELVIPDGFQKKLNDMEITQLINDQLLQDGLMLSNLALDPTSRRIVEANKNSKPIEHKFDSSKRIREYLEAFNEMGN